MYMKLGDRVTLQFRSPFRNLKVESISYHFKKTRSTEVYKYKCPPPWVSTVVAQWLELPSQLREWGFESCAAMSSLWQVLSLHIAPVQPAVCVEIRRISSSSCNTATESCEYSHSNCSVTTCAPDMSNWTCLPGSQVWSTFSSPDEWTVHCVRTSLFTESAVFMIGQCTV